MKTSQTEELIRTALAMRERAYVPYSEFTVGAALLAASGTVYTGCNIENRSFSATNCAERTAIFKAVSEGEREFVQIAVAGGKKGESPSDYCYPCAVCLQVMSEFMDPDFEILVVKSELDVRSHTLRELLPVVFDSFEAKKN